MQARIPELPETARAFIFSFSVTDKKKGTCSPAPAPQPRMLEDKVIKTKKLSSPSASGRAALSDVPAVRVTLLHGSTLRCSKEHAYPRAEAMKPCHEPVLLEVQLPQCDAHLRILWSTSLHKCQPIQLFGNVRSPHSVLQQYCNTSSNATQQRD